MSCSGGKNKNLNNIKMKSAFLGLLSAFTLFYIMYLYKSNMEISPLWYLTAIVNTILFGSQQIVDEIKKLRK